MLSQKDEDEDDGRTFTMTTGGMLKILPQCPCLWTCSLRINKVTFRPPNLTLLYLLSGVYLSWLPNIFGTQTMKSILQI